MTNTNLGSMQNSKTECGRQTVEINIWKKQQI